MPYSQKTNFGNLYPIPSKNGDSICVQHCLQAISGLSENGRMALVVPEGFLFRKDLAKTREFLLEKCNLRSIISLPQGVFLPYTSVKTNIIYCDRVKNHNRKKFAYPHYWYFPVKNDGYTLNNHRRKLDGPSDLDRYAEYRRLDERHGEEMQKVGFELVPFNTLGEEHKLIPVRRTNLKCGNSKFETITIGELTAKGVITIEKGKPITRAKAIEGNIPVIASGRSSPYFHNEATHNGNVVTISSSGAYAGFVSYHGAAIWASNCNVLFSNDEEKFGTKFLYYILKSRQDDIYKFQCGSGQPNIRIKDILTLTIPILSPEEQKKLVAKLDEMSNAIRCAETLINTIKINAKKIFEKFFIPEKMRCKKISEISTYMARGKSPIYGCGRVRVIKSGQVRGFYDFDLEKKYFLDSSREANCAFLRKGDLLINSTGTGTAGRVGLFDLDECCVADSHITVIRFKKEINPAYVMYFLAFYYGFKAIENMAHGSSGQIELGISTIGDIEIQLPAFERQTELVKEIEETQIYLGPITNFSRWLHLQMEGEINTLSRHCDGRI